MYSLSLILLVGLIAIVGIRYARSTRELVEYSEQHGLRIFGEHRRSHTLLIGTPAFYYSVMSRSKVEAVSDVGQRELLLKVRLYAIAQAWTGLLIAALFVGIVLRTRF